jgi:energy-coupling factor transport system ATP-binding protein
VAIAGVLAMDPEVLILDEPTAGLDPKGHRDILSMIARIRRERRLTVIWISHNMDNVAELADRVLVMDRGKLIMDASPAEVFSRGTELAKIGLALPSAASLMEKLARRGFPVNTGIFTLNDAEKEIMRVFGRR